VEFQKVLNHRGIVFAEPCRRAGALATGESLRCLGRLGQGRERLQDFLTFEKMLTRKSPSSNRPGRNMPSCTDESRMTLVPGEVDPTVVSSLGSRMVRRAPGSSKK
jgi:hypothetical protein